MIPLNGNAAPSSTLASTNPTPQKQLLISADCPSRSAPSLALLLADESGRVAEKRVRTVLERRREREAIFGANLFGEPAWDMLLQLYATTLAGGRECITSLCEASAVPMTTGLRTLRHLEDRGLILRERDKFNRRRSFLKLSGQALAALDRLFRKDQR